jgi:hypothetical protein
MTMMTTIKLRVSRDFSRTPGSRYADEGEFSGEVFRKEVLAPAVRKALDGGSQLLVDLDGTAGYGTSFLEEAFGGLIRNDGYTKEELDRGLHFKSDEEDYLIDDIKGYIADAQSAAIRQGYAKV